jgi:hypothetical protein
MHEHRPRLSTRAPPMPTYTLRRTWPDEPGRPDDYVFRCDGVDVGRCYLMRASSNQEVWRWTVYGISSGGMEATLEEAKRRFKETFEAAGGLAAPNKRWTKV